MLWGLTESSLEFYLQNSYIQLADSKPAFIELKIRTQQRFPFAAHCSSSGLYCLELFLRSEIFHSFGSKE